MRSFVLHDFVLLYEILVRRSRQLTQQHLIKQHGRTPMGWNEVYSSPKETAPNGAIAGHTILQNWKGTGDADTVGAGFASVDSEYLKLYLNEQCCRVNPSSADGPTARFRQCFYVDPARGLTAAQRAFPGWVHAGLIFSRAFFSRQFHQNRGPQRD